MIADLCILFSLFTISSSLISKAPYMKHFDRTKIAGHRGLSSIFPENTLQAHKACMYAGADFIELDVVLSKEGTLIVSHDTSLSRISDIQRFPEFQDRKKERYYKKNMTIDWWISDFTVEELKQLKIRQALGVSGRDTMLDYLFTYTTLKEVVTAVQDFNKKHKGSRNSDGNLVGILLETKNYEYHLNYTNTNIAHVVMQFLRDNKLGTINECVKTAPLVLISFDSPIIMYFHNNTDLPRGQLVRPSSSPPSIKNISGYAHLIGSDIRLLWNQTSQSQTKFVKSIRNNGLLIYGWVFREDKQSFMELFNSTNSHDMFRKAIVDLKLNGIIAESPDVAQAYAQAFRSKNTLPTEIFVKQTVDQMFKPPAN